MKRKITKILNLGMVVCMAACMTACGSGTSQNNEIYNPEGIDDEFITEDDQSSNSENTGDTSSDTDDTIEVTEFVPEDKNGDYANTMSTQYFRVGALLQEPFLYDEDDAPAGFTNDLALLFGYGKLGVQVTFTALENDEMLEKLDSGDIDCVWMKLGDERLVGKDYDCTVPIINDGLCVVTNRYQYDYMSMESLKGQKIAVVKDSEGEEIVKGLGYEYVAADSIEAMLDLVSGDECLAGILPTLEADEYLVLGAYTDLTRKFDIVTDAYGFVFRSGSGLYEYMKYYLENEWIDVVERATSYSILNAVPIEDTEE